MRKSNIFIIVLLFFTFTKVLGQKITVSDALNKAGQQRMLCERITKDYLIIGANPKSKVARAELDYAASVFNENFHDLTNYAKSKETINALKVVSELWAKFRVKVFKNPDIDFCPVILADASLLVQACDDVLEKIQLDTNVEVTRLSRLCAKQRLLSQRLAKLYMIENWEVPYGQLDKEMNESINIFEYSLGLLMNYGENTPEIKKILNKQYEEWSKLKKYFEDRTVLKADTIFTETNTIVKDFDRATTLYEKIADSK
jgi:Type IV pili methyl-accepting chemotaxis transducer N-term